MCKVSGIKITFQTLAVRLQFNSASFLIQDNAWRNQAGAWWTQLWKSVPSKSTHWTRLDIFFTSDPPARSTMTFVFKFSTAARIPFSAFLVWRVAHRHSLFLHLFAWWQESGRIQNFGDDKTFRTVFAGKIRFKKRVFYATASGHSALNARLRSLIHDGLEKF